MLGWLVGVSAGYQGAYGIVAEVESHPFDLDAMLFMDWRDDHLDNYPDIQARNSKWVVAFECVHTTRCVLLYHGPSSNQSGSEQSHASASLVSSGPCQEHCYHPYSRTAVLASAPHYFGAWLPPCRHAFSGP